MSLATLEYTYSNAEQAHTHTRTHAHTHNYLFQPLEKILTAKKIRRIFEIGCGNGSTAAQLAKKYEIVGVDASKSGIAQAKEAFPNINLDVASAYDDLAKKYGQFDAVVSLEVVEHLYDPRTFAKRAFDLVSPGGFVILSTPYHGYWKNLALAVTGKMDAHFTALWDGGHIKFWSVATLSTLLNEAGFIELEFQRVGRIHQLAKSMICVAKLPG